MQTIKVIDATNPHRKDSRRANAFDAAVKAGTVDKYKASPFAKPKYLQRWQAMGLIKLEGEAPVKAPTAPKAAKVAKPVTPAKAKPTGLAAKLAKAEKAVK